MVRAERRCLLGLALAAVPAALAGRVARADPPSVVGAGRGRDDLVHGIGVSTSRYKVTTRETGGALFVMEHSNHVRGGPTRHLHH